MKRRALTRAPLVLLALAVALLALDAAARPGGGQGYSGGGGGGGGGGYSGGGSSSGGGGGDAGVLIYWLVRLVIEVPIIGVPLLLGVIYFWYTRMRHVNDVQSDRWSSDDTFQVAPKPARRPGLAKIRARDPEFSTVLFEDFVYALYARVHAARSDPAAMAALAPYVAEGSRSALLSRDPVGVPISGVVVGAMQVLNVKVPGPEGGSVRVDLKFEANYTAMTAMIDGQPQGYYVDERWGLERSSTAVSKPPGQALEFRCPNCGAPFESTGGERCRYCQQDVGHGRFDWTLTHVRLLRQETRPPALTADVAEHGTDAATVFDPRVQAEHAALIADDPGATPELIERRLRAIYSELNIAWSNLELQRIRPLVSDSLFNYLEYWIFAYRNQGLRNMLEEMAISRVQFVKLTRDRHYDAITLRFWASGRDYTVRAIDGERVSGSKSRKRSYSEYWTLIRGAKVRGAPREPGNCPSCGAGTERVNMAGTCEYCGAHLTRGEFDWVLSKIEQDDSYAG